MALAQGGTSAPRPDNRQILRLLLKTQVLELNPFFRAERRAKRSRVFPVKTAARCGIQGYADYAHTRTRGLDSSPCRKR